MVLGSKRLLVGLWIASAVIGMQRPVRATEAERGRIVAMLSAHDTVPDAEEWRGLGEEAVPILHDIAQDREQPTFRRMRALIALGSFSDDRSIETLYGFATSADVSASRKCTAIVALASASAEKALPVAESALASDDLLMRQTAVTALSAIPGARAKRILETQRKREEVPFVVEQIDRVLERAN